MLARSIAFLTALGLATLSAPPSFAQSAQVAVALSMDWSADKETQGLARDLVQRGLLPVPLVFVGAEPRAMLDDGLKIVYAGDQSLPIHVGIVQFIERPLYSVDFARGSDPNAINVTLHSLKLTRSGSASGELLTVSELIDRKFVVTRGTDNAFSVSLPAGPYATIAQFVAARRSPLQIGTTLPVRSGSNKTTTSKYVADVGEQIKSMDLDSTIKAQHFAIYRPGGNVTQKAWDNFVESIPDVRDEVDVRWFASMASVLDVFKSERPESILLRSVPSNAEIWLGGTLQPTKTDGTIQAIRRMWNLISLKLGRRQCLVDPSKVKPPGQPDGPSIFECKLAATSP